MLQPALLATVLIAALMVPIRGNEDIRETLQIAKDLFAIRGVEVIVVAMTVSSERMHVFHSLASDGRFQVSAPSENESPRQVLDAHTHVEVGVILRWDEPPPAWLQSRQQNSVWFNATYHWLVVGDGAGTDNGPLGWGLRLDSEVYRASETNGTWLLEELFRVNPREQEAVVTRPFAEWSPSAGLVPHADGPGHLEDRRTQIRRVLAGPYSVRPRAAAFCEGKTDPATLEHFLELPETTVLSRMSYLNAASLEGFYYIFQRYDMKPRFHVYFQAGELERPSTGFFTAAVGAVQRGAADMFTTGAIMSDGRLNNFKYGMTTFTLRTVCLFLSGGLLGTVDALVMPLHWTVWVTFLVIALVSLLLNKCLSAVEGRPLPWSDGLLSCLGTFTGQGFGSSGDWASGRALLIVFEVLFMLLQSYYSSAIVTHLLRPLPPTVRSGTDLAYSDFSVDLHDWWIFVREFELAASGSELQLLWEKKIAQPKRPKRIFSADQLSSFLTKTLHAIIGSQEIVYKVTAVLDESQACRMHEMAIGTVIHIGPMIGRHVDYYEIIFVGTLVQRERGVWRRVNSKWQQRRTQCGGKSGHGGSDPIGLAPILPVLAVLLIGVLASSAIAALERAQLLRSIRNTAIDGPTTFIGHSKGAVSIKWRP